MIGEWWFSLDGKTPAERRRSLAGAATAYRKRFNNTLPAHRRIFRIGKTIYVSFDKPPTVPVEIQPARVDTAGRDVTDLPGLWDESDIEPEPWDPAIEQLHLLPMRDLEALYMHAVMGKGGMRYEQSEKHSPRGRL